MDLLADIGHADQLNSAREENRVLQSKVKELSVRVHELLAENQALKAEVEIYREEFKRGGFSRHGLGEDGKEEFVGVEKEDDDAEDFITAGNGIYPSDPAVVLSQIHGNSNPLCCTINPDDSLLATGGADSNLNLCRWGLALAPGDDSSEKAVADSIRVPCGAPVICVAFAQVDGGRTFPVVAAGCMDGSVCLAYCGRDLDASKDGKDRILRPEVGNECNGINQYGVKHGRYVKTVCWSPSAPILASASADGTVQLTRVGDGSLSGENFCGRVSMEVIRSIHFDSPVESMCFLDKGDTLCCYVRGTSYLSYFNLKEGFKQTKHSLNGGSSGSGCFNDHVSFSVLSLCPSPNGGKYLALATDCSRNIIMETGTSRIVRNLYGHKNDGYSNPKIAWSSSGQYLYGNSQDENCVCVWDIASSSIVKKLDEGNGGHTGLVRDIYSSQNSDTVVTVSFDRSARVWLRDM
ncbi:hypothetical protein ACHAWX_003092 [Stephanocyclus meneghinianus]